MIPYQQFVTAVWTLLGFMLVAALVLHLRYKPVGDGGALYLDTWTGRIETVAVQESDAYADAPGWALPPEVDLRILEGRVEREVPPCGRVRFAFPAHGSTFLSPRR